MLKIQETKKPFKNDKITDKPASFAKLPLLTPVKSPKEVKNFPNSLRKVPN